MSDYILSCSSTVDLTPQQMKERNIRYVCFHFILDGQDHKDDMGQSIAPEELYSRMVAGAEAKTSQVALGEYTEYFEQLLQEGKDILHVEFSSGLSGSYNSARLVVEDLKEKYPDRKIYLVDSLAASSGYGLIMETLADMRDAGKSVEELYQWIEENRLRMHHWFFSTDLTFYIRGGRISKTAGAVGTLLGICPLLNMDNLGRLQPREKIRTKKKVIRRIVEMMEAHAQDGTEYSGKCYICQSACLDDAKAVAALVEEKFPKLQGKVEIYPIGATIGSHTGPGTVALFFWGDERKN
ncbi:fatty acid-binding protein DegV [Lachnoclostridium sp. An196]|uniref:DegV family protein n=1 Tax=Lachnoclostridium sp. An196 TaxID=1965583 RepID=UPI000B38697C|nr:DegV family protein [Lachnoclostridium sp. An196]OUP17862.1 fatty acid-binding protein DegV [Lachnoclostridium sp. An196]